ncbi:superoxide reductase [Methylomarinovum tepidoasis]|uniref:Superoxide reductase n=1 Tax=Methylomarinovum tepidoasis TaxID=2840183 RepID=A0AAU9D0D0_9GAMM|nr:desulfoferrodoxin family protein [Methylomarinovum sp. IN45]BCX88419.1 superoxide reductase [Methylomarinovum sp. IN45]
MRRRHFMTGAAVLAAAGAVRPALAAPPSPAGGVYYTQDLPGRWKGKEAGHVPRMEVLGRVGGLHIRVTTAHPMDGCRHYIVKHVILDGKYRFLDEHLFDPEKDKVPVSEFNLGTYRGQIYLLSMCNLHDVWLATYRV